MKSVNIGQKLLECALSSTQGEALFDANDILQFANSAFLKWFDVQGGVGVSFEAIMRHCFLERSGLLIEATDFQSWFDDIQSRRRRLSSRSFEADFVDGRWVWVNENLCPDGWLYFSGTDITTLKLNEALLCDARDCALLEANTDQLTGLYNRRYITAHLARVAEQLEISSLNVFSIVILDLDHFKDVNDRHGHQCGDSVLRHFSTEVRNHLRPSDLIGRVGGEEFLIFLPNTSIQRAQVLVQRFRLDLKQSYDRLGIAGLTYTFSAGIAEAVPFEPIEALLERADAALYAAKRGGRDRHELAGAIMTQRPA